MRMRWIVRRLPDCLRCWRLCIFGGHTRKHPTKGVIAMRAPHGNRFPIDRLPFLPGFRIRILTGMYIALPDVTDKDALDFHILIRLPVSLELIDELTYVKYQNQTLQETCKYECKVVNRRAN